MVWLFAVYITHKKRFEPKPFAIPCYPGSTTAGILQFGSEIYAYIICCKIMKRKSASLKSHFFLSSAVFCSVLRLSSHGEEGGVCTVICSCLSMLLASALVAILCFCSITQSGGWAGRGSQFLTQVILL